MIYVSTACMKANRIKESVTELGKAGIRNIELSGGTQYYSGYGQDLIMLKEKYNLQFTSHGYFPPAPTDFVVNLASCNDEIYQKSVEFYINSFKLFKMLECKALSVHAGFYMDISPLEIGKKISLTRSYDREMAEERFCKAVQLLKKSSDDANMLFLIENNVLTNENFCNFHRKNLFMMTDSQAVESLRHKLDFDLLLDLGHLKVSANTLELDYQKEFGKLIPQAKWLHLHDNDKKADLHNVLTEDSHIYRLLEKNKKYIPDNITIEAHADITELLRCYSLVEQLIQE